MSEKERSSFGSKEVTGLQLIKIPKKYIKANLKKLLISYHPHHKKNVTQAAGKTFLPYSNLIILNN